MLLGALLVGLVGCSPGGPVAGSATAAAPTASPLVSPSVSPSLIVLPPRPREVRLDGLDPCTLLTVEQRRELELDQPPRQLDARTDLYKGVVRLCSIGSQQPRAVSLSVTLSVTAGIEVLAVPRPNVSFTLIDVQGFPALLGVPDDPSLCNVFVDVAPGQLVDIQLGDAGRKPPVPQPDLCVGAKHGADLAVASLLARK